METKLLLVGAALFGIAAIAYQRRKAIKDTASFVVNLPYLVKWLLK